MPALQTTGVILAGGLARRMHHADKGLVLFQQRPLISYAISALTPLAETVFINANRNLDDYKQFGLPVIPDITPGFDGPLVGILTAMHHTDTSALLVMPCDSPLVRTEHLQRLLQAFTESGADAAVAFDGVRNHSVFLALKPVLQHDLQAYLQQGERKVDTWLYRHNTVKVDFSEQPEIFININTMAELNRLQYPSLPDSEPSHSP